MAEIKLWTDGVEVEDEAMAQIRNVASLPIVGPHVAIMPDVHWGIGATVGSVIPTRGAIIPAAVGVDIGCGVMAVRTNVAANALHLARLRAEIEDAIPVGGPGVTGSWAETRFGEVPVGIQSDWQRHLALGWANIVRKHPTLAHNRRGPTAPTVEQLGTLGTGNHFIEVCIEPTEVAPKVWLMLHSGSRGPGNRIGTHFIERARDAWHRDPERTALPDPNLAWLTEGSALFGDYIEAVGWAQEFAASNRRQMMDSLISVLAAHIGGSVTEELAAINCHHNYVEPRPGGIYVTRKGAVSARAGELGIIPGSMGARSYIVVGKGNPESFESCSHGAGRRMSRGKAKTSITLADHATATAGVECRKDAEMLDESPAAYKDIDAVMAAQTDLVTIAHTLKQIVCVKG
jgi:tRNA-splicing ligase RtcB (3'-phosphate/5'-hydroxy nucleic acid ligase)